MADDFNRAINLFKGYERVFAIMGVWPLQSTYVKFFLWIIYILVHMSMEYVDLFNVFGNLELMVANLLESALEIMIILKLLVMRFSTTLVKLMNRIVDGMDEKNFGNTRERKIYLNYNRVAKKFFGLWLIMGIAPSGFYHMKPLEFRLKAVLQNESMPFVLPYRARIFFDVNDSATFWLVWLCQSPLICVHTFHSVTIGYLFSLVLHVCGKLSVLSFRIKNLDPATGVNHDTSRNIFRDIVSEHRHIIGLARDINKVFGLLLLEELLITTLLIGLASYSVLANVDVNETADLLSFLLYLATMVLMIYGYCVAGEYLVTESTKLHEAYYQCQWCDMSDSVKKELVICMIGTSKPIQLTGGGFYIFSMVNFTSIMKTAAGYISMLRTMI